MDNIIEYYYNLKINNLKKEANNYTFTSNHYNFILKEIESPNNINIVNNLANITDINKIIPNNEGNLLSNIEKKIYALILIRKDSHITLANISNLSNTPIHPIKELERNNWELLWEQRVDFLEEYLNQNSSKYPILRESANYFIGMSENAIAYLINTKIELPKDNNLDRKTLSHITFHDSLYDPFNIIFDHKARDLSEYIKLSFFQNNTNIFKELDNYFKKNNFSRYGIQVLYSRLLYPSFFFHAADKIIEEKIPETYLIKLLTKATDYATFLYNIHIYLSKYYPLPIPLWLKKNEDINPHLQL